MAQPRIWLDEVIDAIRSLGGKAHYDDIYQKILDRRIMNFDDNPNWRAAVRQNIEMYSSDSDAFSGKRDVFYSVEGKGKGIWGLRPEYLKSDDTEIPLEVLIKKERQIASSTASLSDEQLISKANQAQSFSPRKRNVRSTVYERNIFVSEHAKRRAHGRCQLCGKDAPFADKNGKPYLETHHIIWLSEGGHDTIDNTVALCPNCHRKMHILNRKEDIKKLCALINQAQKHGAE